MLIEHNVFFLDQGIEFIQGLSDDLFVKPSINGTGGGIGPHFRHTIEHFESLINGLPSGKVDYDHRKRDIEVERVRTVAIGKLEAIRSMLLELALDLEKPLLVKTESHASDMHDDLWVQSSLGRELISVISHTVHHYALISFIARYYGQTVDVDFGVAPSTLRYQASRG